MKISKPRNSTMCSRTWWTRFSSSRRIVTLPWPSTRVTGSMATRRSLCGDWAVSRLSMSGPSIVMQEIVIETRHAPHNQIVQIFPDRIAGGRAAGNEIVDPHDLVDRVDLVEQERQLRIVRHMRPLAVRVAIDLVQDVADVETIAHRRQPAVDRAGADRDQDLGVGAQFP